MIGQTISHYKILEKLGSGGMGDVWKATDTKLGRPVALKLLASHLLRDEEARKRFHREAQAAASLSHPNVTTIHEINEADGKTFLALEYVEGETLEQRIEKGPLALQAALDIARQIADGLQAAHAKGIVHRDIKPGNVLITPDGRVKILDFGLALLTEGSKLTQLDTTVGTVAYMSPEQAQGGEVDHRTDIWALGCLLYEMVAGVRPFKGQYDQALLYEIVNEQPEPLTGVRAGVPMELEFIVGKCLAKDREDRHQSATEVAVDLRTLSEKLTSGKSTILGSRTMPAASAPMTEVDPAQAPSEASLGGRSARLAWIAASVCLLAAVYFAVAYYRVPPAETNVVRYQMPPPPETPYVGEPAISPDGRLVAFSATTGGTTIGLWIRRLDSLAAQPLEGTDGGFLPFWSPDSKHIGYFGGGILRKAPATGGASVKLADVSVPGGGSWNRDGLILFSVASDSDGALYQVPSSGGVPKPVTKLDRAAAETEHLWPHFLPDGRHFVYLAVSDGREMQELRAGTLDGAEPELLRPSNNRAEYATGHLLFVTDDTLVAQPFEPSRRELSGSPFPVAEDVYFNPSEYGGSFSASANGALIYATGGEAVWPLHWFDRSGNDLGPMIADGFGGGHAEISPDDKRVVFDITDPTAGNRDIWVRDLERGLSSRLTFDSATDWVPIWSPDGGRIAFTSDRDDPTYQLYQKDSSGVGEAEVLLRSKGWKHHTSWSIDGQFLAYEGGGVGNYDLWILPLSGEREPYSFLATEFMEMEPQFSPDGRWLAYASNETGRHEVYIRSFDQAEGGKWQVSTNGAVQPRWRRDGAELYYLAADGKMMAVPMQPTATNPGPLAPRALFQTQVNGISSIAHFAVTSDGEKFLISARPGYTELVPLTVVLNWTAGME